MTQGVRGPKSLEMPATATHEPCAPVAAKFGAYPLSGEKWRQDR